MALTKEKHYTRWASAKQRCENKNCPDYKNYGGRGIELKFISSRDMVDYLNNLGGWFHGATLERIDNSKHYERGNLKWASRFEQRHNRRATKPFGAIKIKGICKNRDSYQVVRSGKYLGIRKTLKEAIKL